MKKRLFWFFMLITSVAVFFVACDLLGLEEDDPPDDDPQGINAEQAKVEIRAASQQLNAGMDEFQTNKAFVTISYLYELLLGDSRDMAISQLMEKSKHQISLSKFLDIYRNPQANASIAGNRPEYGFYKFNFATDTIELVKPSQDTMQAIFPANEQAYNNQLLNAVLTGYNIQLKDVEYTTTEWDDYLQEWVEETHNETIPINVDISFVVDNETIMTANYNSTITDEGRPTAVNATVSSYYGGHLSFTGTGLEYNTTMEFSKSGGEPMAAWNLDLTYTANMESIKETNGNYTMYPLSFDGYVNYEAIEQHQKEAEAAEIQPDYDFMNSQMKMEVKHLGLNAVLGELIFMEYIDPEDNEAETQYAVLYEDGSWDWLNDIVNQP